MQLDCSTDLSLPFFFSAEGDPNNYLIYYQRGTVYLALGKAKFALNDLTRVLELKPDFVAARFQRGTVHIKVGDYTSAERDFYDVLQMEPYHQDANYWYGRVQPARDQYVYILEAIQYNNHANAIQLMTQLLEISPWSKELREMRADSHIAVGDILSAVSDLKSVNRLTQDSTDGYFKLSHLLYQIGHASDALKEIRECLKLDPEHQDCFPFYKKIKKVEKALTNAQQSLESGDYDDCLDATKRALKLETEIPMIIFNAKQLSCTCHVKAEKYSEAIGQCREALEIQKDPSVLCDRAEAYMETDMFEDGMCVRINFFLHFSLIFTILSLFFFVAQLFMITKVHWKWMNICNGPKKGWKRQKHDKNNPNVVIIIKF